MNEFFRFPHTPHLAWLGKGQPRDDKVLSANEAREFLSGLVVLEEKVDGANLGLSIGADGALLAQNRGQYLQRPFKGQFSRLESWMTCYESALTDALGENQILFGEWLAATHSIAYDLLPDFFLVFDVYDRSTGRFWSTARRNALAERLGFHVVRNMGSRHFELSELTQLVLQSSSAYRQGSCEGIYLRREDADWLIARTKLVRPDFVQSIEEHWRSRTLRWNRLWQPGKASAAVPPASAFADLTQSVSGRASQR
jgi:ATP-dependent RNA circularization protein (DNA/RNA ligase family)